MRVLGWLGALGGLVVGVAAAATVTGRASAAGGYEEPAFVVASRHDGFEVRTYAPTIEARVTVPGTYGRAVSSAFGVLAGYIFGGNEPRASIAMTTPVSAQPAGESIAMTAPVSAMASADGWTVAFTMPSSWTMATLPRPVDPRVRLVEVPSGTWAVRGFGGRASDDVVERELAALDAAARAAGVVLSGPPVVSQFDPPWVLGAWRRNEVRRAVAP